MTLPCFHCDKELESALPDGYGIDIYNQPYAGTAFIAQGHYGSTVWDFEPGFLEINICDDCLREKAKGGDKILHVVSDQGKFEVESWVPYE